MIGDFTPEKSTYRVLVKEPEKIRSHEVLKKK